LRRNSGGSSEEATAAPGTHLLNDILMLPLGTAFAAGTPDPVYPRLVQEDDPRQGRRRTQTASAIR